MERQINKTWWPNRRTKQLYYILPSFIFVFSITWSYINTTIVPMSSQIATVTRIFSINHRHMQYQGTDYISTGLCDFRNSDIEAGCCIDMNMLFGSVVPEAGVKGSDE